MNAAINKAYNATDRMAENAVLKIISRGSMALALPCFLWALSTADDMRTNQFVIQSEIKSIKSQIEDKTSDRYTGAQATRDWVAQNRRDDQQDVDRRRVESRVERVENMVRRTN